MTNLKNEDTWKRIVQAAQVRSYRPVTDLAESHGTGMPPEFNYHRECYQMFTHKKTLNKIKNSLTLEKEKDLREEEDLNDLINSCNGYLSNIQMPEKHLLLHPLPPIRYSQICVSSAIGR